MNFFFQVLISVFDNFYEMIRGFMEKVLGLITFGLQAGPGGLIALGIFGAASAKYLGLYTFACAVVTTMGQAAGGGHGIAGKAPSIVVHMLNSMNAFLPIDLLVACTINYWLLYVGITAGKFVMWVMEKAVLGIVKVLAGFGLFF